MQRSSLKHLQKPKFRDAVLVSVGRRNIRLQQGTQDCEIATHSDVDQKVLCALLKSLKQGGRSLTELAATSGMPEVDLLDLLTQFDDLRLLSDSSFDPAEPYSNGTQLLRALDQMEYTLLTRREESAFVQALRRREVGRNQLIGYALEYYWLVRAAPSLIAPALSHAMTPRELEVLICFFRSELNHDRYLAKSLSAIGVDTKSLDLLQPLPSTFALGASLAVYAKQHLNSFRAVLRLFERAQPNFEQLVVEQAQALGMPEEFYAPMAQHSRLNAEADHDDISETLMALVPAISGEECAIVKRHYHLILETQFRLENEIFHHYAGAELRLRVGSFT